MYNDSRFEPPSERQGDPQPAQRRESILDKWRRTRPDGGLIRFFGSHPWTLKVLYVLAVSALVIVWYVVSGRFIHAAWAKVITSIALILGLLALFFIWSLLVAWIRGKAKWPLALTFAVIMIPILVLSFRPALVGEKSWILVLLPWGVILAIIAMFCLCGVLAPRIGRITTSGLYGLLFGMLLLAYNLMRNRAVLGLISLAIGPVFGIIACGLVTLYDRTKRSKYGALFLLLWLACLFVMSLGIIAILI